MSTPLQMYRGDTGEFRLPVRTRSRATRSKIPADLTDCQLKFTAKLSASDPDSAAVIRLEVGSGITVVDAESGLVDITVPPEATELLDAPVTLVWDLQVVDAAGKVKTTGGTLLVEADVTLDTTAGVSPGYDWATRSEWHVNSSTGNDAGPGTSEAPLRSLTELERRIRDQRLAQNVTVYLNGDFSTQNLRLEPHELVTPAFIHVRGAPATTRTGVLSAVTPMNNTTQQATEITDAAIGDWSTAGVGGATLAGERIRLTAGAQAGAVAWIAKRVSATVARTSAFHQFSTATDPASLFNTLVAPTADAYVIESLTKVGGVYINAPRRTMGAGGRFYAVILEDLDIVGDAVAGETGQFLFRSSGGNTTCYIVRCRFKAVSRFTTDSACNTWGCCWTGTTFSRPDGNWQLSAGLALSCELSPNKTGSLIVLRDEFLVQSSRFRMFNGSHVAATLSGFSVWDSPGDAIEVAAMSGFEVVGSVALWGSGNAGYGVRIRSQGRLVRGALQPTIVGASGEAIVGGTARNWADGAYIEPANGAALVLSA